MFVLLCSTALSTWLPSPMGADKVAEQRNRTDIHLNLVQAWIILGFICNRLSCLFKCDVLPSFNFVNRPRRDFALRQSHEDASL